MTLYRRITPDENNIDWVKELERRLAALETPPTGSVTVRDQYITTDPITGVSTIFGVRPDGSRGLQQFVNDTTPPGQPSAPTAEGTIGGAVITWNGLEALGNAQPEDYAKTVVQYTKDYVQWVDGTTIYDQTTTTVGGLEIGTEYTFRLVSYDKNGNASQPSSTVSATPLAAADNAELDEAIADLRAEDVRLATVAQNAQTAASDANTAATNANSAALAASGLAASKGRVIYSPTAPTADADKNANNLWIDTDDNKPYRWVNNGWSAVTDKVATDAAAAASTAQNRADQAFSAASSAATAAGQAQTSADGKATVWYTGTAPAGTLHKVNDLWFDSANGNRPMRWSGSAWVTAQDASIAAAKQVADTANIAAGTAQTAANNAATAASDAARDALAASNLAATKGKVLAQTTAPTGVDANAQTLWIDTSGTPPLNTPKRWTSGTTWVAVTDKAATDAAALATSKGKVIIQSAAPATADRLVQNLWIDTTNGTNLPKRWNTTTSTWDVVTDKTATDAASAAAKAQADATKAITDASNAAITAGQALTSADGKATVWYSTTAPAGTGYKVNDLWFDSANGNRPNRWDGSAWVVIADTAIAAAKTAADNAASAAGTAQTAAGTAQTDATKALSDALAASNLAATKGKVLVQSTAPTGVDANAQTLWIDTTNNANTPKRWTTGTTWVAVTDKTATDAASLAATKGKVLAQTTAPTGTDANTSTLWIDTTNGANTPKRWTTGTTWVAITDKVATDAASLAASKGKVLIQSTTPAVGDQLAQNLWIDTTGNLNAPKRWNGTAWVVVTDKAATDAAAAAVTAQNRADAAFTEATNAATAAGLAQTAANGKARVWYTNTAPAGTGHAVNDLWFDSANGNKPMRWDGAAWVSAQDASIATAQSAANTAQTAANGKNKITYSTSVAPTGVVTGAIAGDTWFRRDASNNIIGHWEYSGTAYVARLIGNDVIAANLNAGKITAGIIGVDRLDANDIRTKLIAADLINAGDILVSGSITAASGIIGSIDAGVITVGTIAAGQLDATIIRTKLLAAPKINADDILVSGSITATSGVIASLDASKLTAGTIDAARLNATDIQAKFLAAGKVNADNIIATGSITATSAAVGSLDASKLTTGTLDAARIGAKSIATDKLLISSTDNLIQEPDMSANGSSWPRNANITHVVGAGLGGGNTLRFTGAATALATLNAGPKLPVDPDSSYRGAIRVKSNVALAIGTVVLGMRCYTSATAYTDVVIARNTTALTANTWMTFDTLVGKVVANTINIGFYITVTNNATTTITDVDYVSATRAADGKLIVDGSIDGKTISGALIQSSNAAYTGIKLSANQLVAYDNTATAAGETFRIDGASGSVSMKGTLTAGSNIISSSIAGSTMTGGLIQTLAAVDRGIKLDSVSNTLKVWDSNGVRTIFIDGVTGTFSAVGRIDTKAATGAGITLNPAPSVVSSLGSPVGQSSLQLWTGSASETYPAEILAANTGTNSPALQLYGPSRSASADVNDRALIALARTATNTSTISMTAHDINVSMLRPDSTKGSYQIRNGNLSVGGEVLATDKLFLRKGDFLFDYDPSWVEFTVQQTNQPNNTVWGPGTPALQGINTATYAWQTNDVLRVAARGIYIATLSIGLSGGPATGRTFVDVGKNGAPIAPARTSMDTNVGEDGATATAVMRLEAGDTIIFKSFKNTGNNAYVYYWGRVAKLYGF